MSFLVDVLICGYAIPSKKKDKLQPKLPRMTPVIPGGLAGPTLCPLLPRHQVPGIKHFCSQTRHPCWAKESLSLSSNSSCLSYSPSRWCVEDRNSECLLHFFFLVLPLSRIPRLSPPSLNPHHPAQCWAQKNA